MLGLQVGCQVVFPQQPVLPGRAPKLGIEGLAFDLVVHRPQAAFCVHIVGEAEARLVMGQAVGGAAPFHHQFQAVGYVATALAHQGPAAPAEIAEMVLTSLAAGRAGLPGVDLTAHGQAPSSHLRSNLR